MVVCSNSLLSGQTTSTIRLLIPNDAHTCCDSITKANANVDSDGVGAISLWSDSTDERIALFDIM